MRGYFNCHNHTEYSNLRLLDCINKPKALINKAIELGLTGIAITDHECLSAHMEVNQYAKELREKNPDFTIALGNEIYLTDTRDRGQRYYHFILIAKDAIGHRQLRELSTIAWKNSYVDRKMERVPLLKSELKEIVSKNKGHLIATTACIGGELGTEILKAEEAEAVKDQDTAYQHLQKIYDLITFCIDLFGDDFYIECAPSTKDDQIRVNKRSKRIAEAFNLKMVVGTDSHYLTKAERQVHKAYLNSKEGEREVDDFYEFSRLMDSDEIFELLGLAFDKDYIEHILNNTIDLQNKITFYSLERKQMIPKVEVTNYPASNARWRFSNHSLLNKLLTSDNIQERYWVNECLKSLEEKGLLLNDEYLTRLETEADVIKDIGEKLDDCLFAYFNTFKHYIDLFWECGSIVGPGRGSATGFLSNYLLGITQLDPIRWNLPYWRFLNKERAEYPDIDFDVASYQKEHEFNVLKDYMESIGGGLYRICTYSTLGAKSAIKTACKGIGINNDDSAFISSLLPIVRGKVRSISDTYYGNEKEGLEPVTEFVNVMDKYSEQGLLDIALSLEGLVVGMGSHASGVIPVNEAITKTNSLMKTAGGDIVTAFDLHESELLSNIKYDFLIVAGIGLVQYTLEELVKQGKIEWKGTLRETYNSVLHPDVIDKEDKEIWDNICQGKIMSCFQFETPVGSTCIKKLQPQSLPEIASANSLMRLRGDGEQPLDKYCRYKADEKEIELDMDKYNLTKEERKICYDLLSSEGMCMNSQELLMISVMKIANFTLAEANAMRKAVSKKKEEQIKQCKELFYSKGKEFGKSINLLDYIWKEQISMQLGYGFSVLHCVAYSWIAIQEAYLYTKYPHVYWNNAILLLESGSLGEGSGKEKATNYGKIASAIDRLQKNNVEIKLPNINISQLGFLPDENINAIHYGLKGVNKINNETANIIIENRPYKSLEDFHKRLVETKREVICETGKKQMKSYVSTTQTIQLIKAGAFDVLESRDRFDLLHDYLKVLYPDKAKLGIKDIPTLIEIGILDKEQFETEIMAYNFKDYISSLTKIQDKEVKGIKWVNLAECEEDEQYVTERLFELFSNTEENIGYKYGDNGSVMIALGSKRKGSFDKNYDEIMKPVKQYINTKECLDKYNEYRFNESTKGIVNPTLGDGELEAVSFRIHEASIDKIDNKKYGITNYFELEEEPEVAGYINFKGNQYPKFKLQKIVGMVLDKDNTHSTVSLLTQFGVVNVKYNKGSYAFYNKNISFTDENGKKIVLEKSMLEKGTKLFVIGYRRGSNFIAKKYTGCGFNNTTMRITNINVKDGTLTIKEERSRLDD